jgi:3',5'-cyclic AMP phosphodiesterase CpdA
LLQLSDLHFGPNSRFAGVDMDGLAGRCADAVRDARRQLGWKEHVGLVLVTGDIAEAARPGEYESALTFFGALVGRLGMLRSAMVFVPATTTCPGRSARRSKVSCGTSRSRQPSFTVVSPRSS